MPQTYKIPSSPNAATLTSSPCSYLRKGKRQPLNTPPFFSKHDRKWRWWHYLSMIILFIGLLESFAVSLGYRLIHGQPSPLRIPVRQYPSIPYQHFNVSTSSTLDSLIRKGITVYHVSKEFGPSTMGSIGSAVTSLALTQQRSGHTEVAIVMPYYSFLKNKYDIDRVTDLVIDLRDKDGKLVPIEFRVWKMIHLFSPPTTNSTDPTLIPHTERVPIYLIGPGNRKPFNQAFRCRNSRQIYSSPGGLPHEWRDQFFAKAAAQFLAHRATAVDEESLFAPLLRSAPHIDIIHLHGATNAYVAKLLDDKRKNNQLGATPPSIVYTMHDHLDEWQYTNTVGNVKKFLDGTLVEMDHVYGNKMVMSRLGIDRADLVTFASRSMAMAMVEGTVDLYLKELVMDPLLQKAQQRRFFGISNTLDLATMDPFINEKLVARRLNYPDHAWQLLDPSWHGKRVWKLSASSGDFVATAKDKAKRFLSRRHLFSEAGTKRPLMLAIHNEEWVDQAAQHAVDHNMTFILLAPTTTDTLVRLKADYPDHIHILSTPKQHRQWSIFCRAAADFIFTPTHTQPAIEGLLFGTSIISTGADDLQEILIDRPQDESLVRRRDIHMVRDKKTQIPTVTSGELYNAYLFKDTNGLALAIKDAMLDYQRLLTSKALREEYNLRMITHALGWNRHIMYEYRYAYALALHHRALPELTRHEVDEEQVLLRRLYQSS